MYSGNKSSSKVSADTFSTGAQDDDCLTWLQYPTDDAFERSYCSDLCQGGWPLAAVTEGRLAISSIPDVFNREHEIPAASSVGTSLCQTESQPSTSSVRKHMGTQEAITTRPFCKISVEEALAQGAARAAGHSWPVDQDSMNKVRTLKQPNNVQAPLAGTCHSVSSYRHLTDSTVQQNLPLSASISIAMQKPKTSKVNMLDSYQLNRIKYATTESTAKRSRTESESHLHMQQPESSHITETGTLSRGKEAVVPDDKKWTRTSRSDSGASQTSILLNGRGKFSRDKLEQDDSELFLDDFTEDDSADTKKRRKLPEKRNRVPEVHNISERNRRNKINEKLKALQDLVPKSSKTDKASLLDDAIEYMKALQTQLQMVLMSSRMNVSSTMMPMSLPQTQIPMAQPQSVGIGVPIGHTGMGLMPETGLPIAATLFQCPATMMSPLHTIPFHSQNVAGFALLGFPQNSQFLPTIANIQQRPNSMQWHQDFNQGWSPLQQPDFENETASIEQDDFSD